MADPTRRRGRPCADGPDRPLTVQALDRALDMLDLLSLHPGLTLSEVAQRTGLPASATHRILQTLALRGMVERCAATQCWSVGPSKGQSKATEMVPTRVKASPASTAISATLAHCSSRERRRLRWLWPSLAETSSESSSGPKRAQRSRCCSAAERARKESGPREAEIR